MTVFPTLAVIGGTGLYKFPDLKDVQEIKVDTPFGKPSSPIVLGSLNGKKVAFIARHGIGHTILPGEINNSANIYALKSLGVSRIIGVSACGSLRDDYAPGHVVIPDQLFDFTRARKKTFFGDGIVAHIGSADPFCPDLMKSAFLSISQTGVQVHKGGTAITIEGPRFSTKAESHLFRSWGMSIIGMTTAPEVFLAREAEMCYASIAHVTDYDVWHASEKPVTVEMVIQILNQNIEHIQQSIRILVDSLDQKRDCTCDHALDKAIMTAPSLISTDTRKKLGLLIEKYIQ